MVHKCGSRCLKPKQNHVENKGPIEDKDYYVVPLKGDYLKKIQLSKIQLAR